MVGDMDVLGDMVPAVGEGAAILHSLLCGEDLDVYREFARCAPLLRKSLWGRHYLGKSIPPKSPATVAWAVNSKYR